MCNFNKQNEDTKAFIHLFMSKASQSIGGTNFLLALIEAIRAYKPHPLTHNSSQIASNNSIIKWNKVVFKDKVDLIHSILDVHRSSENPDFNILSETNNKKKKNIVNMIRALTPIEFVVTPQNHHDGGGFSFKVFDRVEEDFVSFNPVFVAMFFCSTEFTKKALKYTP
ncbi:MAG: hypothetical protein JXQ67_00860 [Campylobacterales bacterium]|nr:hypothetical protein [Campylobacterales bacterium]